MPQWFEMEKGPFGSKGAKDILWSEGPVGGKGGIVEFGNALKRGGYGTDLNYVPKLCDSYYTVVNRMRIRRSGRCAAGRASWRTAGVSYSRSR
jgi:hypothetical protein